MFGKTYVNYHVSEDNIREKHNKKKNKKKTLN